MAIIPLGWRLPATSGGLPASSGEQPFDSVAPVSRCARDACLCGLAPDGVCLAVRVTAGAVGSYPAVSPLPSSREKRATAVFFLWHSPRRFRHRALPGIVLCGARTFLPPAATARAGDRPSGVDAEQSAPMVVSAQAQDTAKPRADSDFRPPVALGAVSVGTAAPRRPARPRTAPRRARNGRRQKRGHEPRPWRQ